MSLIYRLKIFLLRVIGYEKPLRVAILKYLTIKFRQFRPHYETIMLESAIEAKKTFIIETVINTVHPTTKIILRF